VQYAVVWPFAVAEPWPQAYTVPPAFRRAGEK